MLGDREREGGGVKSGHLSAILGFPHFSVIFPAVSFLRHKQSIELTGVLKSCETRFFEVIHWIKGW